MTRLFVVPLELVEVNDLIQRWHRHHKPVVGHRFSLGVIDELGIIHGGAVVGRPVARMAGDPRDVAEVTRLVADGEKNVCSMLYQACARAAQAIGFKRIQTYILESEAGTSLKAAGWMDEGEAGGGQWVHTDGKPRRTDQPTTTKRRYARVLNARPDVFGDIVDREEMNMMLWDAAPEGGKP